MEEKEKKKGKRGGWRNGGRPRLYKVQLCVYLSKQTAEDVKEKAKESGQTISEFVEAKLNQ